MTVVAIDQLVLKTLDLTSKHTIRLLLIDINSSLITVNFIFVLELVLVGYYFFIHSNECL